jgi:hypothetical protein
VRERLARDAWMKPKAILRERSVRVALCNMLQDPSGLRALCGTVRGRGRRDRNARCTVAKTLMDAPVDLCAMPGGRWVATCGRCMRISALVHASSKQTAWRELEVRGWTAYQHSRGSRRYAVCPNCSDDPKGASD